MELAEFFRRVLPETGIYALFTSTDKKHVWCDSIEGLVNATLAAEDRGDIYFATATFKTAGTEYRGRKGDNVDRLKALRLDIDAGPDKSAKHGDEVYASAAEAIQAIRQFSLETKLVPSIIVSSGAGFHVYYELEEPVDAETWLRLAKRLKRATAKHKLKADASVTTDLARVLRPIGTHHKSGSIVRVVGQSPKRYGVEQLLRLLEPDAQEVVGNLAVNADIIVDTGPKSFRKIVVQCGAMRHAYKHQEQVQEPLWRLAIGVAKHTAEGFSAAKALSFRHPEYDEDELRDKYDRWDAGPTTCAKFAEHLPDVCAKCQHHGVIKSPIVLGATSVEAEPVEGTGGEGEPQLVKANDSNSNVVQGAWSKYMPDGFCVVRTKAGRLGVAVVRLEDEELPSGEVVKRQVYEPFTDEVFWFEAAALSVGSSDKATVQYKVLHNSGHTSSGVMEQDALASPRELCAFMAGVGVHTTNGKNAGKYMLDYSKLYLQRVKDVMTRERVGTRFGLRIVDTPDGKQLVAAQGAYIIRPDKTIVEALVTQQLAEDAKSYTIPLPPTDGGRWGPEVWDTHIMPGARAHVEFMRRYYADPVYAKYQLAIMAALASPFMAFTTDGYWDGMSLPGNGMSIALFSENGGKGKTAVMRCAQLAFGAPANLNRDNDDMNTTALARLQRLASAGTMPVCMDEMGDVDPKALAQLIRTVANGAGRARLAKDGTMKNSSTWALVCLISANKSQRDLINQARKTSSAEQFRLIEFDVERLPAFGVEAQVRYENEWKQLIRNAGALGAVIHYEICRMGVDAVNKLVMETVSEAAIQLQAIRVESASRFYFRTLGAVLALFHVLERVGLVPFDKGIVVNEFLNAYREAIEYVEENVMVATPLDHLARMIQDLNPRIIITQGGTGGRGPRSEAKLTSDVRGSTPLNPVGRYIIGDEKDPNRKTLFISSRAVKEWCVTNNVRESVMISAAAEAGVVVRARASDVANKRWVSPFNLFAGMRENTGGQINCYRISIEKLDSALSRDMTSEMMNAPGNVVPLPAREANPPSNDAGDDPEEEAIEIAV